MQKLNLAVLSLALASASTAALATPPSFDVSDGVAGIAAIAAGVALIGAAKLVPAAVAVGWKWMKATIFG